MSRLRRPLSWYGEWMGAAGPAVARRKEIATELMQAIQLGHYDSETLEQMQQVLDHERSLLEAVVYSGKWKTRSEVCSLKVAWILHLLTQISGCLVVSIGTSAQLERELQARICLSAIALLRAHGVNRFQPNYHDAFRTHLEGRHRDSVLQRASSQFTAEKFRGIQTSYLLCLAREYSRSFARDESRLVAGLNIGIVCGFAALSIGTSIAMSNGIGNLQSTVTNLDSALKHLWREPSEYARGLFNLQELTHLTIALHISAKVGMESSNFSSGAEQATPSDVLSHAQALARSILHKVLSAFDEIDDFELRVSQSSPYWEYFRAFVNHGPRRLDVYFYLYGLLDCATQLARIITLEDIHSSFRARMRRIITQSKEPSFRWKAIEFLLCQATTRLEQEKSIIRGSETVTEQLTLEVNIISQCLQEEEGSWKTPRSMSLVDSNSTVINSLQNQDWKERPTPNTPLSVRVNGTAVEKFCFKFGKDLKKSRSDRCSIYLSPNCEAVVFLLPDLLSLYSIANLESRNRTVPARAIFERPSTKELRAAAISNGHLAVLTDQTLTLYEFGAASVQEVGSDHWTSRATSGWTPRCLAIHETDERIWVAIGGRIRLVDGDIKMYRFERRAYNLIQHNASFHRPGPDSLAGDHPWSLSFSSDGNRISSVTNQNRVLVWFLSNNIRPRFAPFQIEKKYGNELKKGVTSATIFYTVSDRPYILCTTMPSSERSHNKGEWSYISPVGIEPAVVPQSLEHGISELRESSDILTGAASATGRVIALLHQTGAISLLAINSRASESNDSNKGGLTVREGLLTLKTGLEYHRQSPRSPLCMRFCQSEGRDTLIAIDSKGNVIRKRFPLEDSGAVPRLEPSRALSDVWADLPVRAVTSLSSDMSSQDWSLPGPSTSPAFASEDHGEETTATVQDD